MAAVRCHNVCRRVALTLLMGSTARGARTGLRPRGTINATRGLRSLVEADRRRLAAYDVVEVAKLTADDAATSGGFGGSVAIDGDTVVIGAGGAVYVLRTSDGGATYGQVAKLTASDAESGDQFGLSVAIYGDTVVIGARDDDDGGSASGSAYVFSPPAPTVQPTPEPSVAALESDSGHSATRAGTLATVLVVVAATALAL